MTLKLDQSQLKYHRVKTKIESLIEQLDHGTKIPSERDLAKNYACNSMTVHKALALLVKEGRIEKRTGAGTFVTDPQTVNNSHIGILLHTQSDTYALRLAGYLANIAASRKLILHTKMIQSYDQNTLKAADELVADNCCSIIIPWAAPWEQAPQMLAFVKKSPLPVTLPALFQGFEDHCFDHPSIFGQAAIEYIDLAGQYFKRMGYSNIAFIGPVSPKNDMLHRKIIGYTNFISLAGLNNLCHLVTNDNQVMDRVALKFKQFKNDLAVISYDDHHAIRLLTAMHKHGLQAPKDYAIMGYNNTDAAANCDPPLSCLYGDSVNSAKCMIDHALGQAQRKLVQVTQPHPLYFKVRDSCSGKVRLGKKLPTLLKKLKLLDMPISK